GDGGAGGGEFGGVPGAAGVAVRVEAATGAVVGVLHGVEVGQRGVAALEGAGPEDGLHVPEVGGVVLEVEAAVAPHGAGIVFVGERGDGARERAAQDAWEGRVVGACHVSPCAQAVKAHGA